MKLLVLLLLLPAICFSQGNYTPERVAEHMINENYTQAFWTARAVYGLHSEELVPILDHLIAQDPNNIDFLYAKYNITKDDETLFKISRQYLALSIYENSEFYIHEAVALFYGREDLVGYLGMAECLATELEFYSNQTLVYFRQGVSAPDTSYTTALQSQGMKNQKMYSSFFRFKEYMTLASEVIEPEYVGLYNSLYANVESQLINLQD